MPNVYYSHDEYLNFIFIWPRRTAEKFNRVLREHRVLLVTDFPGHLAVEPFRPSGTQRRDSRVGIINFHAKHNGSSALSRDIGLAANDVKIETNCKSGGELSQKEQRRRRALVKRPDMRGTTNLMIYVAHATSPAIPNLMLYDRAARRVTYTYVHIIHMYIRMYTYIIRIYAYIPRASHGLSSADLTETYRCRTIRRERPTSAPAKPRVYPRTLPEDRRRVPAVTYRKIRRWYTRLAKPAEQILGCPYERVRMFPENFSYKYNHVATPADASPGTTSASIQKGFRVTRG